MGMISTLRVFPSKENFQKQIEYDATLFLLDKAKEDERSKVFNECHSSNYAGHAGGDIIQKRRQYSLKRQN